MNDGNSFSQLSGRRLLLFRFLRAWKQIVDERKIFSIWFDWIKSFYLISWKYLISTAQIVPEYFQPLMHIYNCQRERWQEFPNQNHFILIISTSSYCIVVAKKIKTFHHKQKHERYNSLHLHATRWKYSSSFGVASTGSIFKPFTCSTKQWRGYETRETIFGAFEC